MTTLDQVLSSLDNALRTLFAPAHAARTSPAAQHAEPALETRERSHAASLMRVNHVGEICAQALYQGQALTARNPELRSTLAAAAREEEDHLAWCERRIEELGGRKSLLNPLWYAGSFTIGAVSGLLGDRWNLGFLAETERQVEGHLAGHLGELPAHDAKSRAIVEQMQLDEARHAATAENHGARELPAPLKIAMRAASKVMTTTAYWV